MRTRGRRARPAGASITVQQSFPDPRPTTNPYIVMLRDSLAATPGVEVRTFSWRRALTGRYDVFHAHWPEILVQGSSPLKQLARQVLFAALLLRLRLRRTPIVRTQHNIHLPTGLSRRQRLLMHWIDRQTTLRIGLNHHTTFAPDQAAVVIPHGHYRDWFARYPRLPRQRHTLGYFGLIRRYKNVESLIAAFTALPGDLRLWVAGKPSSEDLADSLRRLAAADDRVELSLKFLTDAELVEVATRSELIVLPYTHMHNSGGVLASLSLGTPVLVPANPVNTALADEVGPGWVLQYAGELQPADLAAALQQVQNDQRSDEPDLSNRGWEKAGADHLAAYRTAVATAGSRRSSTV